MPDTSHVDEISCDGSGPLIWFRRGVRDCGLVWLACELVPFELRVNSAS